MWKHLVQLKLCHSKGGQVQLLHHLGVWSPYARRSLAGRLPDRMRWQDGCALTTSLGIVEFPPAQPSAASDNRVILFHIKMPQRDVYTLRMAAHVFGSTGPRLFSQCCFKKKKKGKEKGFLQVLPVSASDSSAWQLRHRSHTLHLPAAAASRPSTSRWVIISPSVAGFTEEGSQR